VLVARFVSLSTTPTHHHNHHNHNHNQAGKAVGSGAAAVVTVTQPFLALSPGALAIESLIVNLEYLNAFLQVRPWITVVGIVGCSICLWICLWGIGCRLAAVLLALSMLMSCLSFSPRRHTYPQPTKHTNATQGELETAPGIKKAVLAPYAASLQVISSGLTLLKVRDSVRVQCAALSSLGRRPLHHASKGPFHTFTNF